MMRRLTVALHPSLRGGAPWICPRTVGDRETGQLCCVRRIWIQGSAALRSARCNCTYSGNEYNPDMRMTLSMVRLLRVFLADPQAKRWGYELLNHSGVKRSTLYPALTRLEDAGWIKGEWEAVDEKLGRPVRRDYGLTAEGERCAYKAVADALRIASALRLSLGKT